MTKYAIISKDVRAGDRTFRAGSGGIIEQSTPHAIGVRFAFSSPVVAIFGGNYTLYESRREWIDALTERSEAAHEALRLAKHGGVLEAQRAAHRASWALTEAVALVETYDRIAAGESEGLTRVFVTGDSIKPGDYDPTIDAVCIDPSALVFRLPNGELYLASPAAMDESRAMLRPPVEREISAHEQGQIRAALLAADRFLPFEFGTGAYYSAELFNGSLI